MTLPDVLVFEGSDLHAAIRRANRVAGLIYLLAHDDHDLGWSRVYLEQEIAASGRTGRNTLDRLKPHHTWDSECESFGSARA